MDGLCLESNLLLKWFSMKICWDLIFAGDHFVSPCRVGHDVHVVFYCSIGMSFAFWDVGSTAQRKILLYYYTTKMMLDVPWVQISHHANIITNRRKMTIHTKAKRFDLIQHLILNLVTTTWYCNMIFISFQVSRNVIQLRNP